MCCSSVRMMVKPIGTGVPSALSGARWVRLRLWPPSCDSTVSGTPRELSQRMASALFTESVLTSPGSVLPPRPDLNMSRSKYFPPSRMPCSC
ncbi:hypothetical protein DQ04_26101000 [Trypanosoma grayi]|uniref:hypothetical protein n=1 Tax=Trypanosoma grayi TaxID=71804 RepID=UPI0004F45F2A|nr:hypothetical protein DQ04_26101000 [Trypanosoma grayi]KEG05182.1 hypothetical protein DQ04_26101000 [Trypanosoma grayi]